jgi:type II secretory pathway pseudopilin PulG
MVVIVIIGVLASLAIPRFTEASAKAKAAEAPNVIGAYETALLAALPELPASKIDAIKGEELIVDKPKDSKWFTYDFKAAATADGSGLGYKATPVAKMGKLETTHILTSDYEKPVDNQDKSDCFTHKVKGSETDPIGMSMVPSFLTSGCNAITTP